VTRPNVENASLGELVSEVTKDLSALMRQEIELARTEVKAEAAKTGRAISMLVAAALAVFMVLLFASFALWWGLSNVMDQSWAALIVMALWVIIAAVLYSVGRQRLREVNPKPQQTVDTLKQVPDALRGR
jgi:ABC-type multidrug transport system fused ATPase/permease subunit